MAGVNSSGSWDSYGGWLDFAQRATMLRVLVSRQLQTTWPGYSMQEMHKCVALMIFDVLLRFSVHNTGVFQ